MLVLKICGELKAMNEHNVLDLKEEIDKLISERLDKKETADDNIPSMTNHPRHYNREGAIECIDEMEMVFGPEATAHFCLLNCWKYRYRAGLKNDGYEDLEKSDWYMRKYKELKEENNLSTVINPIIQSPTLQPWQTIYNSPLTYSGTSQAEAHQ